MLRVFLSEFVLLQWQEVGEIHQDFLPDRAKLSENATFSPGNHFGEVGDNGQHRCGEGSTLDKRRGQGRTPQNHPDRLDEGSLSKVLNPCGNDVDQSAFLEPR